MAAAQPPNLDVFEAYFKRADLDQDGRISGSEAVAFFKGSNLQQPVLAQIWKYCDQNSSGFLSRLEFYNMLRLVTVAQSGRELTPDIVKAALFGPAAAKMPAPQINPVPGAATFVNPSATLRPQPGARLPASAHMGVAVASGSQKSGIRATQAAIPGFGANQQFVPSSNSNIARFPQGTPSTAAYPSYPVQGFNQAAPVGTSLSGLLPASNTSNLSTNSLGMDSVGSPGGTSQGPVQVIASPIKQDRMGLTAAGMTPGLTPNSFAPSALPTSLSNSVLDAKDSKPLVVSGNKLSSDSAFGGDVFSAIPPAKQEGISPALSSGRTLMSSGNQPQGTQSVIQRNSLDLIQRTSSPAAAKLSTGIPNSPSQPQLPWPRISQSDIQKYSKVFLEVDKDRDGKITGEQAYNLFLSWRLSREVLKQVWDLADQDNDSMLSLREFCIALYLMERYREGRPLPASLPDVLRSDETFIQATGRPPISYGDPVWQPRPGLSQQGVAGLRPSIPVAGVRPPMQFMVPSEADRVMRLSQQRPVAPSRNLVVPQNKEQPLKEATDVHEKEAENKILDSKEKIEYYRMKMQELVLYKSRCDNRLNEITERASADKHEAEFLEKKYEEKYKQVAEVASKLTVEEAAFRDIQGRKLELQNAIVNMEKGGSSDGLLQVRADRIQSDLEELVKALHERCKHHGLHVKSKATIDLPFGWEPGIQEGATDWDEDWDKFEDEGFTFAKDLSVKLENDVASTKSRTTSAWSDKASTNGASPVASINHSYSIDEKLSSAGVRITESESAFTQDEYGSVRSPPGSPDRTAFGTSSQEFNSMRFDVNDISPRGKDNHSHGGDESTFSGDKFTDEPSWGGAFDASDDVDSVWGFSTKDAGHERTGQNSFFGTEDFGLDPIRVDSPSASSVFGQDKKSPYFDSLPSTPHLKSSLSPRFSEGSEDHSFDNFSRFDSFGMHGNRLSPKRESLARFDSIASTSNFDHSRGISFDDTDPFGTGPFKSLEIHSPRKNSDNWRSF